MFNCLSRAIIKMPTSSSVSRQTWALIRRYCIHERRRPLLSLFKFIAWPTLWMWLFYKFILITRQERRDASADAAEIQAEATAHLSDQVPRNAPNRQSTEEFLPLILLLTISLQLYYYVAFMLTDKSSGMKSLMMCVGLRRSSYYLANFVCFMAAALPLVSFIAILSAVYLFDGTETSRLVILTVFLLYILHVSGLVFVFNSLLKFPSLASLILIASILEYFVHDGVMKAAGHAPAGLVLFLASADPYESVGLFAQSFKNCHNNGTTNVEGKEIVCVSSTALISAMLFWTCVSFLFGLWFDKACPWQTDTANEGLLYCLKSSSAPAETQVELPQISQQSKYFEQETISNRQVGISIRNVSKEFSGKSVLEDVNFKIFRGETTLLLGHNGAGKTTLMNIVLGKLMPNGGSILVDRIDERGVENGLGVCPQMSVYDSFLSVRQHLELFSDIKSELDSDTREQDIDRTLHDVSLDRKVDSLPSELSGGMKRKLSLSMAFVGKSSILILDEPSSGLDPDSRVFVWNAIRRYRADRTVLLSTQHMEEADYLGDRIAIMSRGKIICCGSSVFLTKTFGSGYKLRVECLESRRHSVVELARRFFNKAEQSDNEHVVSVPGFEERILDMVLELNDDNKDNMESSLIGLLEEIESNSQQLGIKSHGLKSSSIEDVLLNTANLEPEQQQQHRQEVKLTITTSSRDLISTLINPLTVYRSSAWQDWLALYRAFLLKHLSTYKNDWKSLFVFRVLIVSVAVWTLSDNIKMELFLNDYSPTLITFTLLVHATQNPILERASGFKTMQMTSSANTFLYWLSQLTVDMLTIVLAAAAICCMSSSIYTATGVLITAAACLLFGLAGLLNCYVLSTFFKGTGAAFAFVAMYYLSGDMLTNFIFPTLGSVFNKYEESREWTANGQMVAVLVFPTDALRYILHGIIRNGHYKLGPDDTPPIAFTTDKLPPLTTGFCALLGQSLFFAAALFFIEHLSLDPTTWSTALWMRCRSICCRNNFVEQQANGDPDIDQDVLDESRKALTAIDRVPRDRYSLVAHGLSKSYNPPIKVVDKLSFAVNRGECFGLLGVNGAGKSTTFSMLVGERRSDTGQIWINGRYVNRGKSEYMRKLGYDPQANPIMSLSPSEALFFMARLRRVNETTIPNLVNAVLEILEMGIHAHKNCHELSGGTMRKLALGMSLIGNPELLLLDEPTAGVDPVARRSIWQLLHDLKARKDISIVITSHAMEECEAICDRISIMARGRLRCVGTFLHLRNKFSQGCTVRIQFSPSENLNNFATKIVPELANRLRHFVGRTVNLADTNINSATYNISTSDFKHSALLTLLRDFKQQHPSITYMVNDSSLEDIFINMAQEQQNLDQANGSI